MAKREREVKQWITVNGVHVPVFEGESKADAVKKVTGHDVPERLRKLREERNKAESEMLNPHKDESKQTEEQKPDLSTQGTYNLKGEKAPKDLPRVSDEDAKHNKTVEYDGQKYQTQQVVDYKEEEGGEYVAGHMYVPINPKGKGSFFVSRDGEMYHSGSDYLQVKAEARWAEQANKEATEKEKQIARNKVEAQKANGGTTKSTSSSISKAEEAYMNYKAIRISKNMPKAKQDELKRLKAQYKKEWEKLSGRK